MKHISLVIGFVVMFAVPAMAAGVTAQTSDSSQTAEDMTAVDGPDLNIVALNDHIVVKDGVIRLGEAFQGSGKYAERVIAYAPRPGSRAVFDARWLKQIAVAFKLNWRPRSTAERLVVERESQVISKSEVEDLLYERLVAEGGDAASRAVLANRSFRLHLPVGEDYLLGVDQISFEPSTGRFSAVLAWGTGKDERLRVTGRLEHMTEVPVLSKRMMGGDVIQQADLKWIDMPQARLARNAITDASHLIGMAAKRSISAGKAVTEGDIRRPKAISKGDSVTLILSTPTMRLTTKGTALESGAEGDTVRITNSQTRTVVEGVITGPGQVRVDPAVNMAMR